MKKTTFPFILVAAIGYTYLFYHQLVGINYLVFDFLILLLLAIGQPEKLAKASVLVSLVGLLASGAFVLLHNTDWTIFIHWLCFGLFVRLVYEPELSLYFALPEQVFVTIVSVFNPVSWAESSGNKGRNWLMYLLLLPVVGLFVWLYSVGNEQFGVLVGKLFDFDFNISIIPFFISGVILAFSIFAPHSSGFLKAFDITCPNKLRREEEPSLKSSLFGLLENELKGGIFLLLLLNLLTLSFPATDVYYFIFSDERNAIVNHSQQVHQGVNSLIVSIVLAIVIVLYFFRGELNFIANNKVLKSFAFVWLFQNVLLAFSTAHRNWMYIDAHGLTHKRIGVFVWLVLVAFGIVWTFIKIGGKKTTWFLLRTNSWTVYVVMLLYTSLPLDRIIVRYNLTHPESEIDLNYLKELGPSAWAETRELKKRTPQLPIENWTVSDAGFASALVQISEYKNLGWPSYNIEKERIREVMELK